jgi:protein ImuB
MSSRRIACIALTQLRIEIVRGSDRAPLAVIVSRPGSPIKSERDVLGSTRLDVVCPEARFAGVRAGQTVAAARAKCSTLCVKVVGEHEVHGALVRVAESMLAFGPLVSFDPSDDVVWVDVGGCAHLHGGEEKLLTAMVESVVLQGHACRVAIAGGPRIASAVARFSREPLTIVAEGKGASAMRALPVKALFSSASSASSAADEDARSWLVDMGLRTCGDLQKLPRRAFGTRLGPRAYDVMLLLDGDDAAPLVPWRPAAAPEESIELEWGANSVEALAFVMRALCDRLAVRLEGRAMGTGRLEIDLWLDRALCKGESPLFSLAVVIPAPVARAHDLFAVVRARLERHVLAAPVLRASLRACELVASQGRTRDLLSPEPKAERTLPPLVAELAAELGMGRVGVLELVDTWIPSQRTRIAPFNSTSRERAVRALAHPLETSALEPSRLLPSSPGLRSRIPAEELSEPLHLVRIEAARWWRRPVPARDVITAWWSGALGWFEAVENVEHVEHAEHVERVELRGWID